MASTKSVVDETAKGSPRWRELPLKTRLGELLRHFIELTYGNIDALVVASRGELVRSTLYSWVRGYVEPSANAFVTLWQLGCNPAYLLDLSEDMYSDSEAGKAWRKELEDLPVRLGLGERGTSDINIGLYVKVHQLEKLSAEVAQLTREAATSRGTLAEKAPEKADTTRKRRNSGGSVSPG